jgi:3-hydroxyisobutyrate dehydrogenase-like beta-hydroxyacid dehydrogenase
MAKKRTKVGFVGLGLMGLPMASCILKAGYPLQVWNRTPDKAEPLVSDGATRCATPAEAARGADFVVVMVADDAALDSVLFSEDGLSRGLKRGSVLINCSSTSPGLAFRAATALRSMSVRYLEAPVMRSVQAAREGKLQMLVGGSRDDLEKAKPILDVLASNIHHVGDIGKAATLKLACNLLVANTMQAFTECFLLARKSGVPFETMMEVLHAGPLDSQIIGYAEQTVVNPGARPSFYLKHMLKDVNLALDLSRQLDVPVPLTAASRQLLAAARNLGHGDEDFGAVIEMLAQWAGVAVRG